MNLKRSLKKRFSKNYIISLFRWKNKNISTTRESDIILPKIPLHFPEEKTHALFILPFFGPDAASIFANSIISEFKRQGCVVHILVYNDSPYEPYDAGWDYVYHLKAQNGRFGQVSALQSNTPELSERAVVHDHLDDWVGDELPIFVSALSRLVPLGICACNYVFLSKSLDFVAPETLRILLTHDVFADRNEKIARTNGNSKGFYFSTTREDEARGLSRADLVVAIQEEEADYFTTLVGKDAVCTMPYVPPRRYQAQRVNSSPVVVGFLASGHYPNVDAIRAFVAAFDFSCGALLRIAGSVSSAVLDLSRAKRVEILGFVDNIEDFYAGCDVIINPDMLRSGLKVKCVEALSFGKPLITTEAAAVGLGASAAYHRASTIDEAARFAEAAVRDETFRASAAAESIRLYDEFTARWSTEATVKRFIVMTKPAKPPRSAKYEHTPAKT